MRRTMAVGGFVCHSQQLRRAINGRKRQGSVRDLCLNVGRVDLLMKAGVETSTEESTNQGAGRCRPHGWQPKRWASMSGQREKACGPGHPGYITCVDGV